MSPRDRWQPPRVRRLDNGMVVGQVPLRRTPVVATALCYRAGAAAEAPATAGTAHFLEHMMFKGSARFAAGEIDRRTGALGGENNAYTGHDATLYYFSFAADRWRLALEIEADRMAGLTLDPEEIESERAVILEEVAMVDDDPWDALELRVLAALYGDHPYGRSVLGRRRSLERVDRRLLRSFHERHYTPGNAALVVAGDVGEEVFAEVDRLFGPLAGDARPAPTAPADRVPAPARARVERLWGEVARLLVAVPAPPATAPEYAAVRVLLTILAGGRASRLHRLLVDERALCSSVSAEIDETVGPGAATLACELMPGARPDAVEQLVLEELDRAGAEPATDAELARARRLLIADWCFAQETCTQRAVAAAAALALFDADHPGRHLRQIEVCDAAALRRAGARFLGPADGRVVGWSLPGRGEG